MKKAAKKPRKLRVQLGKRQRPKVRWYVNRAGEPWTILSSGGTRYLRVWLERRGSLKTWVDKNGKRIMDVPSYMNTSDSNILEVHAPGIWDEEIVMDKKLWVSEGL